MAVDHDTIEGEAPGVQEATVGLDEQAAGPLGESERIRSLDVLRGVAILGIFIVNVAFLAMPLRESFELEHLSDGPRSELIAWAVVWVLAVYKFISLFSLLFGAGMMVQMQRARRAGTSFVPRYLRRLGVLACFGLIHALLIWYGDVLLLYAVMGLVLLAFAGLSARQQTWLAGIALLLGMLAYFAMSMLGVMMEQYTEALYAQEYGMPETEEGSLEAGVSKSAGPAEDDRLERFFAALYSSQGDPTDPSFANAERIAFGEGPFLAALVMRAVIYFMMFFLVDVLGGQGLRVLGMFLLGAALMKTRFFDESRRHWHRRMCLVLIPMGLGLEVLGVWLYVRSEFGANMGLVTAGLLNYLASIVLCMGYLGGICMFVSSGALPMLQAGLAAVGRMALTNYLAQSIIATGIFYWWGLGLYGRWSRVEQLGLVAGVFAGQVIFSVLWLRIFRFGPLEWLWRLLTYLRWQPLLRK